jgi:hypothetical protein
MKELTTFKDFKKSGFNKNDFFNTKSTPTKSTLDEPLIDTSQPAIPVNTRSKKKDYYSLLKNFILNLFTTSDPNQYENIVYKTIT